MEKNGMSNWLKTHWEWASLIGTIYICLGVSHAEIVRVENRLDARANEISQRADARATEIAQRGDAQIIAINQRCDDLHREFYELLKELRKEEKKG